MAPRTDSGPDGSSIKPVSSLRAKFENMNRSDAPPAPSASVAVAGSAGSASASAASASVSVSVSASASTSASPAPPTITSHMPMPPSQPPATQILAPHPVVPPRPSDTLLKADLSQVPPPVPKDRPSMAAIQACANREIIRVAAPSPISPRPIKPPSFMIQPPQSPARVSANTAPAEIPTPSSDAIALPSGKSSSRPHSPAGSSNPPSPPPPRRSAELRRERDTKPVGGEAGAAGGGGRLETPAIPARPGSYIALDIADEASPFNSPPSSVTSSPDLDAPAATAAAAADPPPPAIPARPRPEASPRNPPENARPTPDPPTRSRTMDVGFNPPPVHPAIAIMRRERELDAELTKIGGGSSSGGGGGFASPVNGAIPCTVAEPPPPPRPPPPSPFPPSSSKPPPPPPPAPASAPSSSIKPPPPRPPRQPTLVTSGPIIDQPLSSSPPKRIVSTPTAYHSPSPFRPLGRSNTVAVRTSQQQQQQQQQHQQQQQQQHVQIVASPTTAPPAPLSSSSAARLEAFPDYSFVNRRPPYVKQGALEIATKSESRVLSACGQYVCTTGHLTRVWDVVEGELVMSLSHGETVKGTAVAFKPAAAIRDEGARLWIGNSHGELIEADILTSSLVATRAGAHGRDEVIRIYRHYTDLWTLDEAGTLHVWSPDAETGAPPSLEAEPHRTFRAPRGHTFSMVVGDELWYAAGREVRVLYPSRDGRIQFQPMARPLVQENTGDVTAGAMLRSDPGRVFLGHADGKVSVYSRSDRTCVGVVAIAAGVKISSLAGTGGRQLWAAFSSGRIAVLDVGVSPWTVRKEWQAHDGGAVVGLVADPAGPYHLGRSQVFSLGADSRIRVWDGLLQDDWLEDRMRAREPAFCHFEQISIAVVTWNAGASTPHSLRYNPDDSAFIPDLFRSSGCPDVMVFGFQELVDLEDKTATAKRLLKPKKKEPDQERMSHQYRDWRDFLMKSLDNHMPPDQLYHLLHTSNMVGLFTCIFVKASVRDRIRNVSCGEVKRGMGGLHGNKGGIAIRFLLEDTSICFINCHLAAGQSHANQRHADAMAILDATVFPPERDPAARLDSYVAGGDGSQILDHELCLLNGDLNYRIDTMSRDTVIAAVRAGNLAKLLDRDQLLVARRRSPALRLRAFEELPITFAPTYKYDVGTDNYDTSEKRRSPAWCDRLLFRGGGRITQLDYRRHEVRVSDHRPVSGRFHATVKRIDPRRRADEWADAQRRFEEWREHEAHDEKLLYLTSVCGYDETTSARLIQQGQSRRLHRTQSTRV